MSCQCIPKLLRGFDLLSFGEYVIVLKKKDDEGVGEEICATSKLPSSADVLSTYVLYISYCRIYGEARI